VIIGFVLIFSPSILADNVHWGVAPTWSSFFVAIPVAMIAYTGIETVSNLSEEARDPRRDIPRSIRLVAVAVFAIYLTLPLIALSALPVRLVDGEYETQLGLPPEEGGFANDPVLGLVKNLGLQGFTLDALEIYVGVLAATILLVATNAGVIGASRITYAMASYRQLPEVFRRLHPRFKTPWLALVVFAGIASIAVILPGQTNFLGTMYAFGAMLSFTIAHAAIVALRVRLRKDEIVFRARPNLRFRGVDWPLFALLGGLGTAVAWLVVVVQEASTRWVGLGWLAIGFAGYAVYRRRVVRASLTETVRAPAIILGLEVEYRTILVPVLRTVESEEALVAAARLASDRRATIVLLHVLEVPLDQPLDADLHEREEAGDLILDEAEALLETYAGIKVISRLERARSAGPAIVEEAARRDAELVILGASRAKVRGGKPIFGRTVDLVLRNAPTRVAVIAGRRAA
jgi:basic amino acid/polyamine antiporter, APA family